MTQNKTLMTKVVPFLYGIDKKEAIKEAIIDIMKWYLDMNIDVDDIEKRKFIFHTSFKKDQEGYSVEVIMNIQKEDTNDSSTNAY